MTKDVIGIDTEGSGEKVYAESRTGALRDDASLAVSPLRAFTTENKEVIENSRLKIRAKLP